MPKKASSLLPPRTGGKIFISGFHRTKGQDDVASIGFESLKKSRDYSLYGRGFYMTRTLNAQQRRTMESYGGLIIRCAVDVSRFICFDRAAAYRIWGPKVLLKDQLRHFDWTPEEKKIIKVASGILKKFWDGGQYRLTDSEYNFLGPREKTMSHSALLTRVLHQKVDLDKKVPGVLYTGSRDGPCVLAYDLSRVRPHSYRPEESQTARSIRLKARKRLVNPWHVFSDTRTKYRLRPEEKIEDDIKTYTVALERILPLTLSSVRTAFQGIPSKAYDEKWAFILALHAMVKKASNKRQLCPIRLALVNEAFADPDFVGYLYLKGLPSPDFGEFKVNTGVRRTLDEDTIIFERKFLKNRVLGNVYFRERVLKYFVKSEIILFTKNLEEGFRKILKSRSKTTLTTKIKKVTGYYAIHARPRLDPDNDLISRIIAQYSSHRGRQTTATNPAGFCISDKRIDTAMEWAFRSVMMDLKTEPKIIKIPECVMMIDGWLAATQDRPSNLHKIFQ